MRQGKLLASRLLPWARSGHLTVPRTGDYALAPTERGAIDNLRLVETDVPPPDEGYVQVRVEAAAGAALPDVVGLTLREAIRRLSQVGVRSEVVGSGIVVAQMPPAGARVDGSSVCQLRCQPSTAVHPAGERGRRGD